MSSEEILKEVASEVSVCTKCNLCKGRTKAVPGEGNPHAKILFIGEGPGYHEDMQGRPFVGPAGQFLDELLASIQLKRSDVFIANVVKCRPPGNRDPLPEEISACNGYLDRQIAAINPPVIVTLGRYSMAKFFGNEKVSAIHGRARKMDGRICIAMYHPAAGLHQASLKDTIRADFKKFLSLSPKPSAWQRKGRSKLKRPNQRTISPNRCRYSKGAHTMRAVVITTPGGPEVLEIQEVETPQPAGEQVLVRVHASGINRADLLQRAGGYPAPAGSPSNIPGLEFAGEVEAVGPLARMWKPGQRVMGLAGGGAQAEYILAHEGLLVAIPIRSTSCRPQACRRSS